VSIGDVGDGLRRVVESLPFAEVEQSLAALDEGEALFAAHTKGSQARAVADTLVELARARKSVVEGRQTLLSARELVEQYRCGIAADSSDRSSPSVPPPASVREEKTRAGAGVKPATFGHADSLDYRKTFFDAHPEIKGAVVVHHAVEQGVLKLYPGLVRPEELHSLENLRGIPKGDANNQVHLSVIRKEWNRFYRAHPNPSKQDLLDFATMIDERYGQQFNPSTHGYKE